MKMTGESSLAPVSARASRGGAGRPNSGSSTSISGWQSYVDLLLLKTGYSNNAGIYGVDAPHKWASSDGFDVTPAEIRTVLCAFVDPTLVRNSGLVVSGQSYTPVRTEIDMILARRTDGGCVVCRSEKALIISVFEDPYQATSVNVAMKLANLLRNKGL